MWWKRGLVVAVFLLMPVTGIWLASAAGETPPGAEVTDAPSGGSSAPVRE